MAFNFLHICKKGIKTHWHGNFIFLPTPAQNMSVAHSCPKHVYWNILWQWKWQYFIRPTLQITAPFLSQMVQRKRLLKDKKVKMFYQAEKWTCHSNGKALNKVQSWNCYFAESRSYQKKFIFAGTLCKILPQALKHMP